MKFKKYLYFFKVSKAVTFSHCEIPIEIKIDEDF